MSGGLWMSLEYEGLSAMKSAKTKMDEYVERI